jgi:hypothetical protein
MELMPRGEFDLDMRFYPVPRRPARIEACGGPKDTDPGSTCQFSCMDSCGGNCPSNPAACAGPEVWTSGVDCNWGGGQQ